MDKKKIIVWLAAVAVVAAGFYYYRTIPDANDPLVAYKEAMQADAVGGATPADTLRMFIAALKANDAMGAAQFFLLDDNLSRAKWEMQLADLKAQGMLIKMADDIEKNAKATTSLVDDYVRYELLNNDGTVGAQIGIQFNKFSGVWKLQSL